MARLGPFEHRPHLAVAVSGGPDSMALTLLLAEWVQSRAGRLDALTVDHGLRPESAAEAERVGRWLAHLPAVTHRVLAWRDRKPETGIQSAAREARYALLTAHCRDHGILHLCTAHQRDDQLETHRLRAGHGSGALGLAGMSAVRPQGGVRLLRPLLGVAKAELLALLAARDQPWIADPSNANPAFERARLRAAADGDGDAEARDMATIHRLGLERRRLEEKAAAILADSLTLHDAGWAEFGLTGLAASEPAAGLALGWLLQSLGGAEYPVAEARRREAGERIRSEAAAAFTLGGCYLRRRGAVLEIHRDWGAIRHRIAAAADEPIHWPMVWDDRFQVTVSPGLAPEPGLTVARLGERGIRELGRVGHSQSQSGIPEPARKALPALWHGDRLLAVPQLGFGTGLSARFRPVRAAASGGFTVA